MLRIRGVLFICLLDSVRDESIEKGKMGTDTKLSLFRLFMFTGPDDESRHKSVWIQ